MNPKNPAAVLPTITDSQRITFLEETILGTGKSRFLKSVFLTRRLGGDDVLVDIHTHDVVGGKNLREAIDVAILSNDPKLSHGHGDSQPNAK